MAQVQLNISFNVAGAAVPLTVTPSSATENLTVGTPVDGTPVAVVSGGTAPYNYTLDPNSQPLPAGVNLSEDGNGNITLTGTPTAAGTAAVILNIADSAGASTQLRSTIGSR